MQTKVELKILNPRMADSLPAYATPGSTGPDLRACLDEAVVLQPGDMYLVPTGLAVRLANPACAAVLLPRSDLGHKHDTVLDNLVGLIDPNYQDELKVPSWNRGKEMFTIEPVERIAQIVIMPVVQVALKIMDEFAANEHDEDEFGSTGKA